MSAAIALNVVLWIVVSLALYVWIGLSLSAVFAKAGQEGFTAWIPVYNAVVLLRLGGLSGWLVLLVLVPPALYVVLIVACHRVGRAFGLAAGMTVLAALLFPVWTSVIGWGSARWLGTEPTGPRRRGDTGLPLDARVSGQPLRVASPGHGASPAYGAAAAPGHGVAPPAPAAPSSYGAASPALGVPPRPPAPAAPVEPVDPPAPRRAAPPAAESPPAFRSSARAAAAAAAEQEAAMFEDDAAGVAPLAAGTEQDTPDDDLPLGRSQAPFTQTVPSSYTPPPDETPPAAPRRAFAPQPGEAPAPIGSFEATQVPEGAPAASGPPAAVQDAPLAPQVPQAPDPWAPPAVAVRPTRYSPPPDPDASFETSAEVSAVVGAPTLGTPRSARESVAAQHGDRQLPDAESAFDETIIATRRRTAWMLTPPLGVPIAVTSDVLIIGRRPGSDRDFPDAQLVPVADETRTMSKTHARLELQGDSWTIVDLDSTNGVVLVDEDGTETEATPGVPQRLTESFLLGDAELRLTKKETPRAGGAA